MTELEYYQNVLRTVIIGFEDYVLDYLIWESNLDGYQCEMKSVVTVRDIAEISTEEYIHISKGEFHLAYEKHLEKLREGPAFMITEHISVLKASPSGWSKELNIVSWNEASPKFDIREWNEDHTKMTRGIVLEPSDFKKIVEAMDQYLTDPAAGMTEIAEPEEGTAKDSISFSVLRTIASFDSSREGWKKELNIISWNGGPPKFDIRDWNEDHTELTRGITLNREEALNLLDSIKERGSFDIKKGTDISKGGR